MGGICGTLGLNDKILLQKMCNVIRHRGPDDLGMHLDDNVGLACQYLKTTGFNTAHQLIHNEDHSIWITLDGGIYNHSDLRKRLEERGHKFYTTHDAEVVVHLYEEFGDLAAQKVRGEFAFAIWDQRQQKLLLARDRLGIKPLYYAFVNGVCLFSSEIKSILQYEEIVREVNPAALLRYLIFSCVFGSESIFQGINKLPPSSVLTIKKGKFGIVKYWNLDSFVASQETEDYYVGRLRKLLETSVKLRLKSDAPVGIYLSGGLDSTSILALMCKETNDTVHTFSIGYTTPTSVDETAQARAISNYFSTCHHELFIGPNVSKVLPQVLWYLDEPIGDPTSISIFLLSKAAKRYATIILTGDGGDELFGGYLKYRVLLMNKQFGSILPGFVKSFGAKFLTRIFPKKGVRHGVREEIVKSLTYFSTADQIPAWKRYFTWTTFKEEDLKTICNNGLYDKNYREIANQVEPYFKDGNNLLDRVSLFDIKTCADDRLMLSDRMNMAHAVEVRPPLLDHKVVEFSRLIPFSLKMRRQEKYVFRKAMSDLLPKNVTRRRKRPFVTPAQLWLNELKELVPAILSEATKREYFKDSYVDGLLSRYKNDPFSMSSIIWNLLVLELWQKIFVDSDSPANPTFSLNKLV